MTALERLRAYVERYPKMAGLDDDLVHSIWVDNMDHPLELRIADLLVVLDGFEEQNRALVQIAYGTWGDMEGQPSLENVQRFAIANLEETT